MQTIHQIPPATFAESQKRSKLALACLWTVVKFNYLSSLHNKSISGAFLTY